MILIAQQFLDLCNINIFFRIWFCAYCGLEICGSCYSSLEPQLHREDSLELCPTLHAQIWFIPMSYFSESQVCCTLQNLETVLAFSGPSPKLDLALKANLIDRVVEQTPYRHYSVPRYELEGMSEDAFLELWDARSPFVVVTPALQLVSAHSLLNVEREEGPQCLVEHFDGYKWVRSSTNMGSYLSAWLMEYKWPQQLVVST